MEGELIESVINLELIKRELPFIKIREGKDNKEIDIFLDNTFYEVKRSDKVVGGKQFRWLVNTVLRNKYRPERFVLLSRAEDKMQIKTC